MLRQITAIFSLVTRCFKSSYNSQNRKKSVHCSFSFVAQNKLQGVEVLVLSSTDERSQQKAGRQKRLSYTDRVIGCLHDPANVLQTSSKSIQNTRELLAVCWTFAGSCRHPIRDLRDIDALRAGTPTHPQVGGLKGSITGVDHAPQLQMFANNDVDDQRSSSSSSSSSGSPENAGLENDRPK